MTKKEFIKYACSLGYCNKKEAEEYCEDREEFTDDDYIGVYTMVKNHRPKYYGVPMGDGGYTTKRFIKDSGSEGNR